MAWFLHHLDVIEHYSFQYSSAFTRRFTKSVSIATNVKSQTSSQ
jgi:hypothetical protein